MEDWLTFIVIGIAVVILIGNFSSFQKSAKQKLRKKGLNDLKETLPRTQKTSHKMDTINKDKE
ncbi:hypothetical protein [Colwellia sp. RSH04]|uniref:hypothetical protein n=1 Tax=Colwellia sp. RSH04 TaxID=2305464 RepID=UPI000E59845A|nr:hypothetical protein [Colwellia sp. RSH04]RHW77301.1 hypothetical protein D1094_05340 [Colwellia sp. RSH04]